MIEAALHFARPRRLMALTILSMGLAAAAGAVPASAHATIVSSTIKPGATLTAVPRTLSATFAEGVNPKGSFLRVFGATGDHAEVDLGNSMLSFTNAKQLVVGLPTKLHRGLYAVMWYTVSADDGHKAGGAFTFTIK